MPPVGSIVPSKLREPVERTSSTNAAVKDSSSKRTAQASSARRGSVLREVDNALIKARGASPDIRNVYPNISDIDRVFVDTLKLEKRRAEPTIEHSVYGSQRIDEGSGSGSRREERRNANAAGTSSHHDRSGKEGDARQVSSSAGQKGKQKDDGTIPRQDGSTLQTSTLQTNSSQKMDDPQVLWAIINSLVGAGGTTTGGNSFEHMPSLFGVRCKVCSAPTSQLCNSCRILGYCGVAHQAKDWLRHAEECREWMKYLSGLSKPIITDTSAVKGSSKSAPVKTDYQNPGDKMDGPNSTTAVPTTRMEKRESSGNSTIGSEYPVFKAKALWDHIGRRPDELTFKKGDILEIIKSTKTWWKAKSATGVWKYVPSNFLELLTSSDDSSTKLK